MTRLVNLNDTLNVNRFKVPYRGPKISKTLLFKYYGSVVQR